MDPASAAGVAVSALASVAADAAIGSRLRGFLADRRRKQALTRVIEQAYSTFASNHPDIAASFFDPVFLERPEVSQELARVLTLDDVPNPDVLAQCYAGQFSYRLADEAKEAINDFLTSFNIELEREQGLADLFTHRLTRLSYRLTRSTYEEVSALREELRLGSTTTQERSVLAGSAAL
jgi:hypothetical protein